MRIYKFLLFCFMLFGSQFQITLRQDQKFREVLWSELCSLKVSMCIQNRRQKVFHRGALGLFGGA